MKMCGACTATSLSRLAECFGIPHTVVGGFDALTATAMVRRWIGTYDHGGVEKAMRKSKIAFKFACERLGSAVFFWTFTFRDCLDVNEARRQWNTFLTRLRKRYPNFHGVRIFEMHEHHGVHVHLLTTRWISVVDLREIIATARKTNWGRIHVVRARHGISSYLAKYLSKDRPACLKGWRLWAGFGQWEWTRVKDVIFESMFSRLYRACSVAFNWKGNKHFFDRMRLVFALEMRTISEGWDVGKGPLGKPFGMCSIGELLGVPIIGTVMKTSG